MRGLVVEPSGEFSIVQDLKVEHVRQILGDQFEQILSNDEKSHIYVHELWNVADLPINVFASFHAGSVIGGTSIISSATGSVGDDAIFTGDLAQTIRSSNLNQEILSRLQAHYEESRQQRNFIPHEPDRWIYNGDAFTAIVVGEADDHGEGGIPKYNVWFFSPRSTQPFLLKIVEYSLREVMEDMILGDDQAFKGDPSDHFRIILDHFEK